MMPTRRRAKSRQRKYDGTHFWNLMYGPSPDDPKAPAPEFLRELWESGGREAVMNSGTFRLPGFRPWAWWCFSFPDELKREAERIAGEDPAAFPDDVAVLEWAGFAKPGEREEYDEREREGLEWEAEWQLSALR
jgi:hypothetical protein